MRSLSSIVAWGAESASQAREAWAARRGRAPSALAGAERRRQARIPLYLRGRYMLQDGCEYPCVTRNVSRIGVAIEGVPVGSIGERVVAYLEKLGRIEGRVVRRAEDWFAIEIVGPPHKLDRIDEKIGALALALRGQDPVWRDLSDPDAYGR